MFFSLTKKMKSFSFGFCLDKDFIFFIIYFRFLKLLFRFESFDKFSTDIATWALLIKIVLERNNRGHSFEVNQERYWCQRHLVIFERNYHSRSKSEYTTCPNKISCSYQEDFLKKKDWLALVYLTRKDKVLYFPNVHSLAAILSGQKRYIH